VPAHQFATRTPCAVACIVAAIAVAYDAPAQSAPRSTTSSPIATVVHVDSVEPPFLGPRDAPVVVKLFFLPNQPQSAILLRTAIDFSRSHPKRVRIDLIAMPSDPSRLATCVAVRTSAAQGQFDQVVKAAAASLPSTEDAWLRALKDIAITPDNYVHAWRSKRFDAAIMDDIALWRRTFGEDNIVNSVSVGRFALKVSPHGVEEQRLWNAVDDVYQQTLAAKERGASEATVADALTVQTADEAHPLTRIRQQRDGEIPYGRLFELPVTLQRLPSIGRSSEPAKAQPFGDAHPKIMVTVLCDITSAECARTIMIAATVQSRHSDDMRVQWMPLIADQRISSATLADALLCAQQLGRGDEWLREQTARASRGSPRSAGRSNEAEIDSMATAVAISSAQLSHCRAVMAGTATAMTVDLASQGLQRGPAVMVGGRVIAVLDTSALEQIVREQLQTGWLDRLRPSWAAPAALQLR
jgi:hypothetical protein